MRRNQNIKEYNPKQVRKLRRAEAQGTIGAGQQAKLDRTREARANRPNRAQVQQDMVQKGPEVAPATAQAVMPKPYILDLQDMMYRPTGNQNMGLPGGLGGLPYAPGMDNIDPGFNMSPERLAALMASQQNKGGWEYQRYPQAMPQQQLPSTAYNPRPMQPAMQQQRPSSLYNGMPQQQSSPWGMPQNVSAFGQGMGQGMQQPQAIRRPLMTGGGQSSGY